MYSKVEKLPDYQSAYNYCKQNDAYCKEQEKLDKVVEQQSANAPISGTGSYNNYNTYNHSSNGSLLNYFLMYHLFFSNSGSRSYYSNPVYTQRFSNYRERDKDYSQYRGHGVYSPTYVRTMRSSISSGKTSFTSSSGTVFKSSRFAGSSKSSITGRSISRGGFGSVGRSFSGGRGFGG